MSRSSVPQISPPAEVPVSSRHPRWPFQTRVDQVAAKRFDAEMESGVSGRRDMEGIEPRLQLNQVYHNVRRVGLWDKAGPARVAFVGRLVADGIPPKVAKQLSWRLIEDALYWSEGEEGFDVAILAAEFEAMAAYGEERKFPATPGEEGIAAALTDRDLLFPEDGFVSRRPTTVLWLLQRLGLWDLAKRGFRQPDPDCGQIGEKSDGAWWRFLAHILKSHHTLAEIRDALREYTSE